MTSPGPWLSTDAVTVWHGDCLDVLAGLPDQSVHAVVTDPPYALEFAGKKDWDTFTGPTGPARAFQAWCEQWAAECFRVLKPGGWLLAFGAPRTYHRLAAGVEDAGFEVRGTISTIGVQGFPKSMELGKAIDKHLGAERDVVGTVRARMPHAQAKGWGNKGKDTFYDEHQGTVDMPVTAPATAAAEQWSGWGTALKPAHEPVVMARKPPGGPVAASVLEHGTGGLNIPACRVPHPPGSYSPRLQRQSADTAGMGGLTASGFSASHEQPMYDPAGRWPPDVLVGEEAAALLDEDAGSNVSVNLPVFRYAPKASQTERPVVWARACDCPADTPTVKDGTCPTCGVPFERTFHPTVKNLDLIRWLTRLVTPPGGVVLDPFAGSGTTVEACLLEGFSCVAVERELDYLPLIGQRVARQRDPVAFLVASGEDAGLFELD